MKITITYFGQLRQVVGAESEVAESAGPATLPAVLADLSARHGPDYRRIALDDAGDLRPSLIILVNGAPVAKGAAPALADGDEVTILPAIAGG